MHWIILGGVVALFHAVWFLRLFLKKQYTRTLALFAIAQFPYLLVNLVAPFRGWLDPNYLGYNVGLLQLPRGILVTLVVGCIVLACFFLATKALQNKMQNLWVPALLIQLFLTISIAIPILVGILGAPQEFAVNLGPDIHFSGIIVALIVATIFTIPTLYALGLAIYKIRKLKLVKNNLA